MGSNSDWFSERSVNKIDPFGKRVDNPFWNHQVLRKGAVLFIFLTGYSDNPPVITEVYLPAATIKTISAVYG
jgi:hypothetical protein